MLKDDTITRHREKPKHLAAAPPAHSAFGEGCGCFGMQTLHSPIAEGIRESQAPHKTQLLFCWAQKLLFCTKVAQSFLQPAQAQILHTT